VEKTAIELTDRERVVLLGLLVEPRAAVILDDRADRARMWEVFEALGLTELEAMIAQQGGRAQATEYDHQQPREWELHPTMARWLAGKIDRPMPVAVARVLDPVIERLEAVFMRAVAEQQHRPTPAAETS